jgi:general nucleoside transport system ATP-binding protein
MTAPAVSFHAVTRRFGGVVANDAVSLAIAPGEIHALVGENGAGKTTLMRVLYGLLPPDAGHVEVDGRRVAIRRPADAMRLGIGMVHQHFMLVGPLTVAENVALGHEPRGFLGDYRRGEAERAVAELAERYRLPVDPRARVDTLSVGMQQRVEILKTLFHRARVLVLDEPTAVLTPQEVDDLFQVLRALRDAGTTIVLITHKLAEVKALADRVTVMRAGRVVGGGAVADLPVERIAELMVGHAIAPLAPRADRAPGEPLLQTTALKVRDERGLEAVRGVSLVVRGGEIVGIAGVAGNGQDELVECLAGLRAPSAGTIAIAGRSVAPAGRPGHASRGARGDAARVARARRAAGVAHVPSDRLRRGMIVEMTLAENLALGLQREPALGRGALLSRRALEARAAQLLPAYDVRPPAPRARARQLSGGNQQKLVAARELSRQAPVILAAHPTRGVDLGAVALLQRRLLEERDAGRAVLLVSSELTEILTLADRVLVMYEGRIVHETVPAATDERTLGLHMTGRGGAPAPAGGRA